MPKPASLNALLRMSLFSVATISALVIACAVPALVSRFLVELYNTTFAGSHNLPRISDFLLSRFKGITITLELGNTIVGTLR